ncbi:CBS domain protein [Chitinophaga skermanii]|uniref:CBS domain protein n=1 Tax=Chitinophaga skermanii TaxID=331697 RepID=A0A327R415_9BACT|nr:CBS domain-containing protein [Chitinophaga skermanii]RAJ10473.1 CBS domain protein [Chitinophaga skermanii]
MLAKELISSIVPVMLPGDTGSQALKLMNEYHISQLPLVVDGKYLALVEEDDVLDWEDTDLKLESAPNNFKPSINENAHIFDALKLFFEFKLCVLPVITREGEYLGVATKDNLIAALAQMNAAKEAGGIIVLEVGPRDYSLSEIARIAESNDVTLLAVNTYSNPATGKLDVTLKTNRIELNSLVATFERFNYTIKHLFTEEMEEDLLKKNYDLFMNYISM